MDEGKKEEPIRNSVSIPLSNLTRSFTLQGYLTIPEEPKGIVLFSHGSGSGRNSPRNNYVARALNKDGVATLLVDLLTSEEEQTDISTERLRDKIPGVVLNKFNIALLTDRLISMTDWILQNPDTKRLPLGYFGASTGTAAGHCWSDKGSFSAYRCNCFPFWKTRFCRSQQFETCYRSDTFSGRRQ